MTEVSVEPAADQVPAGFRALMAGFPTGVTIVTAFDDEGRPRGMTCSSVCSVALDPPTLLVCVRVDSPTLRAMLNSGVFAVNLLHNDAQPAAELFASGRPDRFDRIRWTAERDSGGPHLTADTHAVADCRISRTEQVGDHLVVFGEVARVTLRPGDHRPLMYGLRRFQSWPAG